MAKCIENPADCEIHAVIRSLQVKDIQPANIQGQVCEVYGEGAMSDSMVRRWCRQFESGRDNVHDNKRSGHPSVVTPHLVQQIEVKIHENRRFTITDPADFFPNVSWKTVHRIVTENLHFRKLCARCRGGNDNKQSVATTGGTPFRHRHSKTCDAIQQVPRFC